MSSKNLKKSYINYGEKYIYPEYSMENWNLALKHYVNLIKNGYSEDRANSLLGKYFNDNYEFLQFKHWSRNKMGNDNRDKITKKSTWDSGIVPGTRYDGQIYSIPGSSFYSGDPNIEKAKDIKDGKRKKSLQEIINRNLMSMVRVLQKEDMDFEVYSEAMQSLVSLMNIFKKKFSHKILSDATIRTANKFNKLGLKDQAKTLKKFSQEMEQAEAQPMPQQSPTQPQAAQSEQAQTEQQPQAAQPQQGGEMKISDMPEQEPVDIRDIKTPGPDEDDYKFVLDGEVNIEDAAKKLDDVASTLSDRRVIRMLAEFDIMLDKIGIASMFPELAESQSKLIDAFSYALTRVSKMMGQISNARTLIESSEGLPGRSENLNAEAPAQEQPAPEEAPVETAENEGQEIGSTT